MPAARHIKSIHHAFLLVGYILVAIKSTCDAAQDPRIDDQIGYLSPGISVAELVRARGYLADIEHLVAADNYQLEIVRCRNPLFERSALERGKLPIVFIHGTLQRSLSYIMNSIGVRPRRYDQSAGNMSVAKLYELVRDDPANRALPFIAMNFGYEVWILTRRGFTGSRRIVGRRQRTLIEALVEIPNSLFGSGFTLTGNLPFQIPARVPISSLMNVTSINSTQLEEAQSKLDRLLSLLRMAQMSPMQILQTLAKLPQQISDIGDLATLERQFIDTFDRDFWSFSLDEQADFDLPATIEHVLERTGASKAHLLSYSSGGAVTLLGLAARPQLADKISKLVLWAPAVNLGSRMDTEGLLSLLYVFIQGYTGPVPFIFQVRALETVLQQLCSNALAQDTICQAALELIYGYSGGQEPIREYFLAEIPESTSARELTQFLQFARFRQPRRFDFNTEAKNVAKYGQRVPPIYDLGAITLRNMSIYVGRDDVVVAPDDVATTVSQLSVPVELNLIGDKLVHFNHEGYLVHDYNAQLAILPSLIDFDRMNQLEVGAKFAR